MKRFGKWFAAILIGMMVLAFGGIAQLQAGESDAYGSDETNKTPVFKAAEDQDAKAGEAEETEAPADDDAGKDSSDSDSSGGGSEKHDAGDSSSGSDQDAKPGKSGSDKTETTRAAEPEETTQQTQAAEEDTSAYREVKAELIQEPLYQDIKQKHRTDAYQRLTRLWESLMKRDAVSEEDDLQLKIVVSGALPEGTTAEARYIKLEEGSIYTEKGLASLEIVLYDQDGNIYVPAEPVDVAIRGAILKDETRDDNALLIYAWQENAKRAEKYTEKYKKNFYAADVTVYRGDDADKDLLNYKVYKKNKKYKKGRDAVRYTEDEAGLIEEKNAVGFAYDYAGNENGRMQLVLTAQMAERTLDARAAKGSGASSKAEDVSVSVRGALDKEVSLEATEITRGKAYRNYVKQTAQALGVEEADLKFARAFDIKLLDPETGEAFEPDSGMKVSIELADEKINKKSNIDVVHFAEPADAKTAEPEVLESSVDGTNVAFSTDGFSVYVVADSVPTHTYTFNVKNEDVEGKYTAYPISSGVYTQTIKAGEKPIVPQLPSTEGESFAGWYEGSIDEGNVVLADTPYDFDAIDIKETKAIDLYAVYKTYAKVILHDQYDETSGIFPVAYTRRAERPVDTGGKETSAKIKISDLSVTYRSSDDTKMAFVGWSKQQVVQPGAGKDDFYHDVQLVETDEDGCIQVKEELHLYPVFKKIHWLNYYTAQAGMSASYIAPVRYFDGEATEKNLPVPTRQGYTFQGWYTGTLTTTEAGNESVTFGTNVTDKDGHLVNSVDEAGLYISEQKMHLRTDVTLYAKWGASYHIVYWKQKANETPDAENKTYEYAETVTRTGVSIGDTVSVAEGDRATNRYAGYKFEKSDSSAKIENTKGITVLNVYYDLDGTYTASGTKHKLIFKDSVTNDKAKSPNLPNTVTGLSYTDSLVNQTPAAPSPGRKSADGEDIYKFAGWYVDQGCTIRAFFSEPQSKEKENLDKQNQKYVIVDTMPDHDLTLYAGWEPIKFKVDIDPNYGALYGEEGTSGTGATYFSNTYADEPIAEYTHVTRDYVESSSGEFYYVNHDRAYGGADRKTYYTKKPGLATEDTTFDYAPGEYTYEGWYEVKDGVEQAQPYDFSQHTDHNTTLKLRWKRSGIYYLAFAAGDGTLEDDTEESISSTGYADDANVILDRSAKAPAGHTFVGWQVRSADDAILYTPGNTFTLHAENAVRKSGKNLVYLDAVYVQAETASIVYDANGGTIDRESVDLGKKGTLTSGEKANGTVREDSKTAIVSGLANNSKFKLSDGTGFTYAKAGETFELVGWSDKKVYDPTDTGDEKAQLYEPGASCVVDDKEPTTLYAVWQTKVTYHLNSETANWGDGWTGDGYTASGDDPADYQKTIYLGGKVTEPAMIPQYTGNDNTVFRYWATRSGEGTEGNPYSYKKYDFSKPVEGAVDLYAYWGAPDANTVRIHAVDASQATLANKDTDWLKTEGEGNSAVYISTTATEIPLAGRNDVGTYLKDGTVSENYEYAFAAAHRPSSDNDDLQTISENEAITAIKYDDGRNSVVVQYAGKSKFTELEPGTEVYLVFYQKKSLNIKYRIVGENGALSDASVSSGVAKIDSLGSCDVKELITKPLEQVNGSPKTYSYYTFAVANGAQTNVSGMTAASGFATADDPASLQLRNTWQGIQCRTESGNAAEWQACGYAPEVYVLYYQDSPLPKIRYVKEAEDGTLNLIHGCLADPQTGEMKASDSVTYSHETLTLNNQTVAQEQILSIPQDGLTISQKGNHFRMPPDLDDGTYERYLRYAKIGIGLDSAASISDLGQNVSPDKTLYLKMRDNQLEYSFDHEKWQNQPLGHNTIYVIYNERGYDLQLSKIVDTSDSGENALFTKASFETVITSQSITKEEYAAEGVDGDQVTAHPASGSNPGTITLPVEDGTQVRIKGLGQGEYTIEERNNDNYTLTAKVGKITGTAQESLPVVKNRSVSLTLDAEKKVELTNSPKAICRIGDRYFYTLRSMIDYVDGQAVRKATAEMLTDYIMPAEDTLEIPSGCELTLTTAESLGHVAVITRTEALGDVSLFTNNGNLTITELTLNGNSVSAEKPMIQSAGNLTIGDGANIKDCQSSGKGGAIRATAGDITVRGRIESCEAAYGGAIYHSGNGTIRLTGTGYIGSAKATSGDGGAIYLNGGTIHLSGNSKLERNNTSGKGGAIYTGNAVIMLEDMSSITGNTAASGGAIYAETGTIQVSQNKDLEAKQKPVINENTAASGNGGAIYVETGSVAVSGGDVTKNAAESGCGGAIWVGGASVIFSGTAEMSGNTAKDGGGVYADTGEVTVSDGDVTNNTATDGSGGAINAGSGNVIISGGNVTDNAATAGSGGAIHAGSGNVTVSGGSLSGNTAKTNGGAINAGSGTVTLSAAVGGTAPMINDNKATDGNGGAIYVETGAVSVTKITMTGNSAGTNGGAICADAGAVTVADSIFGGEKENDSNTAGGSGGALYTGGGKVTLSRGSMQNNVASGGSGGAIYVGGGTGALSNIQLIGNKAEDGNGGAVYLDGGILTLTSVSAEGNTAKNGAAVYAANAGNVTFSAGTYKRNVATAGGAVGVGSKQARLYFSGDVEVTDNTLNQESANVYLNQDDDAVINVSTLGSNAAIGIHVPNAVVNTRSVPGARFAVYTNNANVNKITNDRFPALTVQSDTAAKKLYWGNAIQVEVRYLASYGGGFPPVATGTTKYTNNMYYPDFNEGAISELAAELFTKYSGSMGLTATAVYGGAFRDDATAFADYVTNLSWNTSESKWQLTKRDGSTADLDGKKIIIYYAEPAYISIENNTDMDLNIADMTVNGTSVINSETYAGYGMIFARNGAIQADMPPITAADLQLAVGRSINLLIPGGRNMTYTLDGAFPGGKGKTIRLRCTGSTTEETLTLNNAGAFEQLTGTTLNKASTYSIIFGDDKIICKVVDKDGTEHPYSKISDAIADIKATAAANPPYDLETEKKATIEMVTDYLLPASDKVRIPKGYNIAITTAAKAGGTYNYGGEGDRAILSRDSENSNSMIESETGDVNSSLTLKTLVIDGKSVRGSSAGGAVSVTSFAVEVDSVDFINVYAENGGALYVNDKNDSNNEVAYSMLTARNSHFSNCNSTKQNDSRIGGGAIHFYGSKLNVSDCSFENCTGGDQAGAVFHRVDGNYESWTTISGCTFTNCSAKAAGGLELDSKYIKVSDCSFEHCVATERNGGGFNAYMANSAEPEASTGCSITLTNCEFNDCQAYKQNGGGFRSTAVYTTVNHCTFTNTSGNYGGGIAASNKNAKETKVFGCTFDRCTASNQGGGLYTLAVQTEIGDYTSDSGEIVYTSITNCTSSNEGGGVYHDRNADGSSLTITNATIAGNQTRNSNKNGGGLWTNARAVEISGAAIKDNTCTSAGGGIYASTYKSLTIKDSSISQNTASNDGGGVWFDYKDDNVRNAMSLQVKGSTIDDNRSGSNGGGIYTLAKTVTIGDSKTKTDNSGKLMSSSISGNTAKNGGGIYQSRNVDGSGLEVVDGTNVCGNTANNGTGGGIYASVRNLTMTSSEVSKNSATGNGGGVWFDIINNDEARKSMKLTIAGCILDTNTSGGSGGGIYTFAKTVVIKAHKEGEGENAVTTPTTISNCTAAASGGGFYHNKRYDGTSLKIEKSKVMGCASNDTATNSVEHGGGGIFAAFDTITIVDSEIKNNSAIRNGGGINAHLENNNFALIIDNTEITGNTSGNLGGGIYTRSQLTLRNYTEITGNRLSTNNVANCAGVYLNNNRTLFIGSENASVDTVIVRDNTTANGALSDLRLWEDKSENVSKSAYVYCNLSEESEIRVVNANKVGTWFGSSAIKKPSGFTDDFAVFKADASTLHGIIDRSDSEGMKIIWAGPPIAKITDGEGNLLYLKDNGSDPAIFDRLGISKNSSYSTVAAFNMLCNETPGLYQKNGDLYNGNEYCIKMLDSFVTDAEMNVLYYEDRVITFTTANKNDNDGYPYIGSGTRASITRGAVDGGQSTLNANGNLKLEDIVIDGGAENGVTSSGSTRCIYINNDKCTVTLGENAMLQNGVVSGNNNGAGVYINKGTFDIKGGVIRNCTAYNGGGVYQNGGSITFVAGNIYQCAATNYGGGVYIYGGKLDMSGGTISNCGTDSEGKASTKNGGGIYLNNQQTLQMSGGTIINNKATTAGGGVAVAGIESKLYFSGKVNISGNTCDASVAANKACNVELNQDRPTINNNNTIKTDGIINTNNGGLLPGSYIGVYVPDGANLYDKHGQERQPFGTFADGDKTATLYSFVNDRNGLKGGIIENPSPKTIYWIQIFSLQVRKNVESSASNPIDPDETFTFKVNIRGEATASGQLNAKDIQSENGDYGEMEFTSNGIDTTTARFTLKAGEAITAMNLSEGLDYEIVEEMTEDQEKRYATLPADVYNGKIGENKGRTDVDPYTSVVEFTNVLPTCKITDNSGNLLYRAYTPYQKDANGNYVRDGNNDKIPVKDASGKSRKFYVPAVYTELTGGTGAFNALKETMFYGSKGDNPPSYGISNGVQIQMLIPRYTLTDAVALNTNQNSAITLTTAKAGAAQFPYMGSGTTATIQRGKIEGNPSMFTVKGHLLLDNIILDGKKGEYISGDNGGIVRVDDTGKVTIQNTSSGGVTKLQNAKTSGLGGAVYVAAGGLLQVTGGEISGNEVTMDGDGAGIYLAYDAPAQYGKLALSGDPSFGGPGTNVSGSINSNAGNTKDNNLTSQTNGAQSYTKARQDIFIAGFEGEDKNTSAASLEVTGNISSDPGSIWVWAEKAPHYKSLEQFAKINGAVSASSLKAFRNARDDKTTGADTLGQYLYGIRKNGDVYWYGVEGSRSVVLRKVNGSFGALAGAQFLITTSRTSNTPAADVNGNVLTNLTSDASGVFYTGELSYGIYYVKETKAPDGYETFKDSVFIITVGDDGVGYQDGGDGDEKLTREVKRN